MVATEAITPTVVSKEGEHILSADQQKTLDKLTNRLRKNLQNTLKNLVEIGRDLIQAKELVGHGNFLTWLEGEFDLSDQTARRFMHVAEVFGHRVDALKNLSLRSVYALAAPSIPESVRETVFERIESGETLSFEAIQSLCQQQEALPPGAAKPSPIKETSFRTEIKKVNKKLKVWGGHVEQGWKRLDGTLTKKSKQELEALHTELAYLTQILGDLLEQTIEAPKTRRSKKAGQQSHKPKRKVGRPKKE